MNINAAEIHPFKTRTSLSPHPAIKQTLLLSPLLFVPSPSPAYPEANNPYSNTLLRERTPPTTETMASPQGPGVAEVKILGQPARGVAVNRLFRHPIIVRVKIRGLTTAQMDAANPTISVALFKKITDDQLPFVPFGALQNSAENHFVPNYPAMEIPPPVQNGVNRLREFTFFYRIHDIWSCDVGDFFLRITGTVRGPGLNVQQQTESTRDFRVHDRDDVENIYQVL